jgi:four helix bundle protein
LVVVNNYKGDAMARTAFENLRVYRLSERLSDLVFKSVRGWDKFAKDTVGRQIVRSADSVGANIAEGVGRGSGVDNRRFVRNARGSLYETKHWLRCAYKRKYLQPQMIKLIAEILDELSPKLNAYLNSISSSPAGSKTTARTTNNQPPTTDQHPL